MMATHRAQWCAEAERITNALSVVVTYRWQSF